MSKGLVRESGAAMAVEPAIHGVDPALSVAVEDQAEVVRRHADALRERQIVRSRELSQISHIANAPFGVPRSQALVEDGVTGSCVNAVLPEGTV